MCRFYNKVFKANKKSIISSIVIVILCVVSIIFWADYCYNIDFISAISAVTMLPDLVIEWVLSLDVATIIHKIRYPLAGLLGFLVLGMIINIGMKPPKKDD